MLRNNITGEIIKHAPIFDNGMSLFNFGMIEDIRDLDEYRKTRLAHMGENFDDIVKVFCGKQQRKQLRKLIGFMFTPHANYNWEPERYKIIESFIQQRVRELLDVIKE